MTEESEPIETLKEDTKLFWHSSEHRKAGNVRCWAIEVKLRGEIAPLTLKGYSDGWLNDHCLPIYIREEDQYWVHYYIMSSEISSVRWTGVPVKEVPY